MVVGAGVGAEGCACNTSRYLLWLSRQEPTGAGRRRRTRPITVISMPVIGKAKQLIWAPIFSPAVVCQVKGWRSRLHLYRCQITQQQASHEQNCGRSAIGHPAYSPERSTKASGIFVRRRLASYATSSPYACTLCNFTSLHLALSALDGRPAARCWVAAPRQTTLLRYCLPIQLVEQCHDFANK